MAEMLPRVTGHHTMSKWIEGKVVGKRQWTERLFSLEVAAPAVSFVAGQFARLALPAPPGSKEPMLGRLRGTPDCVCRRF